MPLIRPARQTRSGPQAVAGPADRTVSLGRVMATAGVRGMTGLGAGGTVVAVLTGRGAERFTHLALVPDSAPGGRVEVRLLAVLPGEAFAEAAASARLLAGFEPFPADERRRAA